MRLLRLIPSIFLASTLVSCGAGVPRATIAPIGAAPPKVEPRPAAARAEEIGKESTIEVVGTDSITGDHVVKVRRFRGAVSLDEPIACDFVADMTSLSAESQLIEDFIKSSRFLDVRRFPEARFTATRVRPTNEAGVYLVEGRLALHGIEKEITFPATLGKKGGEARVKASFRLPRHAFGLVLGGVWERLLEDDIRVDLDLVVRRALAVDAKD